MSYFVDHLADIRLPVGLTQDTGLRRGQRGAIHSLAAHFSTPQSEPAIVVMPTGSGKTAVMLLTPFLLEASRVLIVTPSRLVRSQIAEQARSLSLLRAIGVIHPGLSTWPAIHEVERPITTPEGWGSLRDVELVVGIPNSVSPAYDPIPDPPQDLFDLILVDEAHHSPAHTWNALFEAFPAARRALFTATPFRRDSREIRGKIVYAYPAKLALDDRIFGAITYMPVEPSRDGTDEANDIDIARRAETVLRADRTAGLDHYLMVRVDGKARADRLADTYRRHTQLRLRKVHSGLRYRTIRQTIKALQNGELDGVICVNMLGEGFDFPNLKIAAIHAPHRSLAVTLQFIGRFARTNADNIGPAKFLAVPNDIEIDAVQLYREDAVWQELVPNLLEKGVDRAVRRRQVLQTFRPTGVDGETDLTELSLFALEPFHHVKVYDVIGDVELDADIGSCCGWSVAFHRVSDDWDAVVFITEEVVRPRWSNGTQLDELRRELFIVYYSRDHHLLFICSSVRSEWVYGQLAKAFCPGGAWPLSHSQIRKALLGLTDLEFFNIGMRNRVLNSTTESYRTLAGPGPDKGIRRSDGNTYHEGHVFARALDGERQVTIGTSSLSKIWSNTSSAIPDLLEWCEQLADRLARGDKVITGSSLDYLGTTQWAERIPPNPIAADWDQETYTRPCQVVYVDDNGDRVTAQLLDFDLEIDGDSATAEAIRFALVRPGICWPLEFRLTERPHIRAVAEAGPRVGSPYTSHPRALEDYLNAHPPRFYFADFSSLQRRDLLLPSAEELPPFPSEQIEAVDWISESVNIRLEYGNSDDGRLSIHDYLGHRLQVSGYDIVLYDHGSGELADYLAIRSGTDAIEFELYHCKASKRRSTRGRVDDLYDTCGQVVKSTCWLNKNDRLKRRVHERVQRHNATQFLVGNLDKLDQIVLEAKKRRSLYRIAAVQPGVSQRNLPPKQGILLAMANDYVARSNCEPLLVIGSA